MWRWSGWKRRSCNNECGARTIAAAALAGNAALGRLLCARAAALLARWNDSADLVANAPVILLELAALPVAPQTTPNEWPPGPQQIQAEPEPQPDQPVEKVEVPVTPDAEPLLSV